MDSVLRIGTRGSELALRQVEIFIGLLRKAHPDLTTETVIIHTAGDKHTDIPLHQVNQTGKVMDKGVFIAAIEDTLAAGSIDCAVHSLKDMPGQLDPRFRLSAILPREDNRDILLLREGADETHLTIGTSSVRRAQLVRSRWGENARTLSLRGNVPTRLRKWAENPGLDGIILALAGLNRLGYDLERPEINGIRFRPVVLDRETFMPALCQGAIAIETRVQDDAAHHLIASVNDEASALCVRAERAFLAHLGADCSVPVAGYADCRGEELTLHAVYYTPRGQEIRITHSGSAASPESVGEQACTLLQGKML